MTVAPSQMTAQTRDEEQGDTLLCVDKKETSSDAPKGEMVDNG